MAKQLPFADHSFHASLAVLAIHHWCDVPGGLAEMQRVARRRIMFLTWDTAAGNSLWLTAHYFPEITAFDSTRLDPIDELADALGAKIIPVPVPRDCQDGFLAAFWARPEEYLDPRRRPGNVRFCANSAASYRERPRASGARSSGRRLV